MTDPGTVHNLTIERQQDHALCRLCYKPDSSPLGLRVVHFRAELPVLMRKGDPVVCTDSHVTWGGRVFEMVGGR